MNKINKKMDDFKIAVIAVIIVAIIEIAVGITIVGVEDTLINGSIQSIRSIFNR